MKDMKKDEKIEERFREYFQGNDAPACDLTQAKRMVSEERAARKRGRGVWLKLASALACCAVAVVLCIVFLPSAFGAGDQAPPSDGADVAPPAVFALADTVSRPLGYEEAKEDYGDKIAMFSSFEWADNASCSYTLYNYNKEAVLLRADLRYGGGMRKFDAVVYIDLTKGSYAASDFGEYRALERGAIRTERLDGEYVSAARTVYGETEYYSRITSPRRDAAEFLINLLEK